MTKPKRGEGLVFGESLVHVLPSGAWGGESARRHPAIMVAKTKIAGIGRFILIFHCYGPVHSGGQSAEQSSGQTGGQIPPEFGDTQLPPSQQFG